MLDQVVTCFIRANIKNFPFDAICRLFGSSISPALTFALMAGTYTLPKILTSEKIILPILFDGFPSRLAPSDRPGSGRVSCILVVQFAAQRNCDVAAMICIYCSTFHQECDDDNCVDANQKCVR